MKLVKIIISVILIVIVVAVLGGWLYLRSLLPDVDGELKLAAIQDGVSIVRDSYGVPHIYSENRHDLYFAFGYTQAQDRLFQMDFYRRAAQGKLAEILGKDLLDADKYLRTMGFSRTAHAQLKDLTPETLEMVEAFSEGIMYFIENDTLPIEFTLLGYKPAKWTAEDSLSIGNLTTFQLASWAYQNEILNYLVRAKLGAEMAELFMPVYPADAPPIISENRAISGPRVVSRASSDFLNTFIKREFASNNWVIGGMRTESGKPILCEDSHEEGPELPIKTGNRFYTMSSISASPRTARLSTTSRMESGMCRSASGG